MSPTSPTPCTHDRGRGTTVCLRCRHDQWQAAQRRRQQMLMRILGVGFVVGIVGAAGVGAASTLRDGDSATGRTVQGPRAPVKQEGVVSAPPTVVTSPPPAVVPTPAPAAPPPAAVSSPAPASTRGGFVLTEGRTTLVDSIYAIRSGDTVLVNFDITGGRTRRADKFEHMVRATLPLVYGRLATSGLDSIPEGALLPSRDVIGELETQGMRLTLENGVKISIHPRTRMGRDGELVIAYLTVVER